jgi:hypothetical protein
MRSDSSEQLPDLSDAADPGLGAQPAATAEEPDSAALIELLRQDRLWLLRQIDSGLWAEWRLDLAALERELGQLLEQAGERLTGS